MIGVFVDVGQSTVMITAEKLCFTSAKIADISLKESSLNTPMTLALPFVIRGWAARNANG